MKIAMTKPIVASVAAFAAAAVFAADITVAERDCVDDEYKVTTPEYNATAGHNLSAPGWYAGLEFTWGRNQQVATTTKASVSDNLNGVIVDEFTVCGRSGILSPYVDQSPAGSGLANTFTQSGTRRYMATTTWYFSITPEMLYQCYKEDKDYETTLTIGENNTYTVTAPRDMELQDDNGVMWYPAKGLLGEKVYGDAQLLASAVTLENYQSVRFLEDPSELTFPEGFAAYEIEEGQWGVKMLHGHDWSFDVVDGTNLVATCGTANCPYNNGVVKMWLDVETLEKTYDGASVKRSVKFDDLFETVFPAVSTLLKVDGVANGVINDAGEHQVTLAVTVVPESGDEVSRVLSTVVTVHPKDITGLPLVFSPASTLTYKAEPHTVSTDVNVGGNLSATFDIEAGSTTTATEIGEYTVTVNGTGNFTGTTSGTWQIVNTRGAIGGVAATTSADAGSYEDGTLTVTDTAALAYEDGVWTAGLTLTWPMEKEDSWTSGHAYYVNEESVKVSVTDGTVSNYEETGKFRRNALSGEKSFTYISDTVWNVGLTPAVIEAAIAEEKTSLEYTMRAGALVWGDSTEGDPDGVAFADYKIALSLEEPVVIELGEGETHDLGETVLTTTRIKLAPGASVTATVEQTAQGAFFIEAPGYDIVCSESEGVYTYATQFTHEHDWSFAVVDGTNLVATCANGDCDAGGETRMWLNVETAEKDYDGISVKRSAEYDENFTRLYPDLATSLTVNNVENGVMNDAGEYTVALAVSGLGDGETYELLATVKINQKDITGATLVLDPASTTYNAAEQTVSPFVTVDGLAATIEVAEGSTTAATEIGEYAVTVNGTGNFTGATSGTWEIKNTTGALKSVASANAGAGTVENNTLTVTDTKALGYADGVWTAGLVLTWPMETKDWQLLDWDSYAHYVSEGSVLVTLGENGGSYENATANGSYKTGASSSSSRSFTYLATTTWTVELTPAIIDAALAEEKTALEYTMRAGAIQSDTYAQGVAFADYKIVVPLEGIKLYDESGYQVYPVQDTGDIVAEMKGAIDATEGLDEDGKAAAKSKVDALVAAADGDAKAVRAWADAKTGGDYGALAESDYIFASYVLDTKDIITDASEVAFGSFEQVAGGFAVSVTVDGGDIEAARAKAAEVVRVSTDLETFEKAEMSRISVREDGRLEIVPDGDGEREFFRLEIDRDGE